MECSMREDGLPPGGFTDGEMSLIAEAVRRASARRGGAAAPPHDVEAAVMAAARQGTRTMFGLVKAGAPGRRAGR